MQLLRPAVRRLLKNRTHRDQSPTSPLLGLYPEGLKAEIRPVVTAARFTAANLWMEPECPPWVSGHAKRPSWPLRRHGRTWRTSCGVEEASPRGQTLGLHEHGGPGGVRRTGKAEAVPTAKEGPRRPDALGNSLGPIRLHT